MEELFKMKKKWIKIDHVKKISTLKSINELQIANLIIQEEKNIQKNPNKLVNI